MTIGFRHFDSSEGPENPHCHSDLVAYEAEEELGIALNEVGIPRSEFFVTTKVLMNANDPENALQMSLRRLKLEYVDLYLIHAPFDIDIERTWRKLEEIREKGKRQQSEGCGFELALMIGLVKNIGVSNFRIEDLERVLKIGAIRPVVNQIEFHPCLQQNQLRKFHSDNNILTVAYGPLAPLTVESQSGLTSVLNTIGLREKRTPAQVRFETM
jgi:diketogulonate reductase-like aldo/keto reductase